MSVSTSNGGVNGLPNGLHDVSVDGTVTTSSSEAAKGTGNNPQSDTSEKVCCISVYFTCKILQIVVTLTLLQVTKVKAAFIVSMT